LRDLLADMESRASPQPFGRRIDRLASLRSG
jgi:hypothetical protein